MIQQTKGKYEKTIEKNDVNINKSKVKKLLEFQSNLDHKAADGNNAKARGKRIQAYTTTCVFKTGPKRWANRNGPLPVRIASRTQWSFLKFSLSLTPT